MKICLTCENEFISKRSGTRFCSDLCRATFYQNTKKGKNGEITVNIYSLINPIDNSVFYIGKTVGSLEQRLSSHIQDKEGNKKKREIILSIIKEGLNPIISNIESHVCSTDDQEDAALAREAYWIRYYVDNGSKLCNYSVNTNNFKTRLLSDYIKESTKTKPSGVRFDTEQIEFLKKREKLNTYQKVVDFLLNKYWWEHKVAIPSHRGLPPIYDEPNIGKIENDEPLSFEKLRQEIQPSIEREKTAVEWVQEKRDITDGDVSTYQDFISRLDKATYLSEKVRKEIKFT